MSADIWEWRSQLNVSAQALSFVRYLNYSPKINLFLLIETANLLTFVK